MDHKGHLGLLVLVDKEERKVLQANREHLVWVEDLGTRGPLALLDQLDHQDHLASL